MPADSSPATSRLIILGCGYLGTALAKAALADGEKVSVLTRNSASADALRALGASPVVVADLAADDWHAALDPTGAAIVNCVSPAGPGPEGYRHSFMDGTQSIARWLDHSAAAGDPPARDALFTSSTSVYPQTDGAWVQEDTAVDPAALSPAGALLRSAEDLFRSLSAHAARRTWVLRLAGLYGPGRHHLLDTLREGKTTFPGSGDHWVNLLHRDDAVAAIRACLATPVGAPGGTFNVTDDEPLLKRDLVAWLAGTLGRDAASIRFDTRESPRSPRRQNPSGKTPNRRVANRLLQQTLEWKPRLSSFREGYRKISLDEGQSLP